MEERDESFEIIWACDEYDGIARNGIIPWNSPHSLNKVRELTMATEARESVVIMGRKTWDNIPPMFKFLKKKPDKIHIVITSDPNNVVDFEKYEGKVIFVADFKTALTMAGVIREKVEKECRIFVIGGYSLFEQALVHPSCVGINEIIIDGDYKCDTFLPSFKLQNYMMDSELKLSAFAHYFHWAKLLNEDSSAELAE